MAGELLFLNENNIDPFDALVSLGFAEKDHPQEYYIPREQVFDFEVWPGQNVLITSDRFLDMLESGTFGYTTFSSGAVNTQVNIFEHAQLGLLDFEAAASDTPVLEMLASVFVDGRVPRISQTQQAVMAENSGKILHQINLGPTGLLARSLWGDQGVNHLFATLPQIDHFTAGINFALNHITEADKYFNAKQLQQMFLLRYGFITGYPLHSSLIRDQLGIAHRNRSEGDIATDITRSLRRIAELHIDRDALINSESTISFISRHVFDPSREMELTEQERTTLITEICAEYREPSLYDYGIETDIVKHELQQFRTHARKEGGVKPPLDSNELNVILRDMRNAAILVNPFPARLRNELHSKLSEIPELRLLGNRLEGKIDSAISQITANFEAARRQKVQRIAIQNTNTVLASKGENNLYKVPRSLNPSISGLPEQLVHHIESNLNTDFLDEVVRSRSDLLKTNDYLGALSRNYGMSAKLKTAGNSLLQSTTSLDVQLAHLYRLIARNFVATENTVDINSCTIQVSGFGEIKQLDNVDVFSYANQGVITQVNDDGYMLYMGQPYYIPGVGCVSTNNTICKIAMTENGPQLIGYDIDWNSAVVNARRKAHRDQWDRVDRN